MPRRDTKLKRKPEGVEFSFNDLFECEFEHDTAGEDASSQADEPAQRAFAGPKSATTDQRSDGTFSAASDPAAAATDFIQIVQPEASSTNSTTNTGNEVGHRDNTRVSEGSTAGLSAPLLSNQSNQTSQAITPGEQSATILGKMGQWVSNHPKLIVGVIGALAILGLGFVLTCAAVPALALAVGLASATAISSNFGLNPV